jgi:hypothetical protein
MPEKFVAVGLDEPWKWSPIVVMEKTIPISRGVW